MEIEELKTIWQQYDNRLDHLEKLNKKLIMETLSKKPQKKLNAMKARSLFSLVLLPFILIFLMSLNFRLENLDFKFVVGSLLIALFIAVMCYLNFKGYMVLKGLDLSKDSIIESAKKVTEFRRLFVTKRKFNLLVFPLFFVGVVLIEWSNLHFHSSILLVMIVISLFSIGIGCLDLKLYKCKIERLEKDIRDLNESIE